MEYHSLLVTHLGHVDRVVQTVARRHQLSASDTEELTSEVRVKLLDKDCAILRKFEERSAITTYLTVVVERLCLDFFNERWGKWRASSAARRLGATAILLEQLVARDGLTFDEAVSTLQINYGIADSREALLAVLVQLPVRTVRRFAGEEELAVVASRGGIADPAFDLPEQHALAARIDEVLETAVRGLLPRDRLLIRMHYQDGTSIADIARLLKVESRPLYTRLASIERALKREFARSAIDASQVGRVVGHPAVSLGGLLERLAAALDNPDDRDNSAGLDGPQDPNLENGGMRPSKQ